MLNLQRASFQIAQATRGVERAASSYGEAMKLGSGPAHDTLLVRGAVGAAAAATRLDGAAALIARGGTPEHARSAREVAGAVRGYAMHSGQGSADQLASDTKRVLNGVDQLGDDIGREAYRQTRDGIGIAAGVAGGTGLVALGVRELRS